MDCTFPGPNIKAMTKTLHSLVRFGDDLYIEARLLKLSFFSFNMNKTICARCDFYNNFFSSYKLDKNECKTETDAIKCRVQMKTILPAFRGNHKKLEIVKIEYPLNSNEMIIHKKFKSGVVMTQSIKLMDLDEDDEGEGHSPNHDPYGGCNTFSAPNKILIELLSISKHDDKDITLVLTRPTASVRNYKLDAPPTTGLRSAVSEVNLTRSYFEVYDIHKPTIISFSIKPIRVALQFTEGTRLNVEFNFETPGKTLSIMINDNTYALSFLVGTTDPTDDNVPLVPVVVTGNHATTMADDINLVQVDSDDDDVEDKENVPVKKRKIIAQANKETEQCQVADSTKPDGLSTSSTTGESSSSSSNVILEKVSEDLAMSSSESFNAELRLSDDAEEVQSESLTETERLNIIRCGVGAQ